MIRIRHISHPIGTARFLFHRTRRSFYRYLVERKFRNIRRDQRIRCFCGGVLLPFKWHTSYGVCPECGCYVNQRPPRTDELKNVYSSKFYWGMVSKMRGWPTLPNRAALYKSDGRLDHWLRLVEQHGPSRGTVIEIGCAPGVLLAELQVRGYRCIGVEAEDTVAQWVSSNMNLDVRTALFPNGDLQLPNCDMFLAFDVLEHVPAPDLFMKELARLLNPGGIVIIQTPIDRYDHDTPLGRPELFDDIEHLFIFVDKAMQELGTRANLEVISLNEKPWYTGHELVIYRKPKASEQ